ncbi:MAG TPA: hypothetical protein VD908_18960 [Cytophagales bacterium]|nr:hypothetical protein [Cytophagales bacterium]
MKPESSYKTLQQINFLILFHPLSRNNGKAEQTDKVLDEGGAVHC